MDKITISWKSEIPKLVRNFRDGMITLFAGLIPFQQVIATWLNMSTDNFTTICGIGILVTGVFAKMFGISDQTTVSQTSYGDGPGGSTNPDPKGLPPKPN